VLAKIIDEPAGSSELTLSGLAEMATQLNSDDPMVRREVADVFKSVLSKGRALAHLATLPWKPREAFVVAAAHIML